MDTILGYTKDVSVEEGIVTITYQGIDYSEWSRIKRAAALFHEEGLGPELIDIEECRDDDIYFITTHEIAMMRDQEYCYDGEIEGPVSLLVREKVEKLHSFGWVHGDLCANNIGHKVGDPYEIRFIDYDTCFELKDFERLPWIRKWYSEGFSWQEENITRENALEQDFASWEC